MYIYIYIVDVGMYEVDTGMHMIVMGVCNACRM